ncbi:MAG: type 2 lantipeptide synthetase LanM [Eubacterium sp.]|nr:type 2 lantipeptide synthetase LanM [Eubacterium sp.]
MNIDTIRTEKNITEKRIDNWLCLFPKKNQNEVDEICIKISGKTLEDFNNEYSEEKELIDRIEDTFERIKKDETRIWLEQIFEKIYNENKWVHFYTPLFYKYIDLIDKIKESYDIVGDTEILLGSVLRDVSYKLSDKSYRVLMNEYNNASVEKEHFFEAVLKDKDYDEKLFERYPGLYEVMDSTVRYSLEYVNEILKNTNAEIKSIAAEFNWDKSFGKIRTIQLGTGDTHNNGRTVAAISFEDGKKLMYKPHSLRMEESYGEFVDWLREKTKGEIDQDYCRVYRAKNVGWTEFIENTECLSEEEVKDYYRKMGELLCILYTFSAKDFHCENIIARGKYPIPIDMETLIQMQHSSRNSEHTSVEETICDFLEKSVYTTALLPSVLHNFNTDESMEVGGISSGRKRISPFKAKVVEYSEGDKLSVKNVNKEIPLNQNLPVYKGEKIGVVGYFSEVKNSFEKTYRWILEHKEEYIKKVIEIFGGVECRVIFKTTNNYTQLLATSYHPSFLHNKIDREVYFHRIGLLYDEKEDMGTLYRDEIKSMMNGDVPAYFMMSDDTTVYNMDHSVVYTGSSKTPLEDIEEKINNMSLEDMERQISLIYLTFDGCKIPTDVNEKSKLSGISCGTIQKEEVLAAAKRIADKTIERAFNENINGHKLISWLGFMGMGENGFGILPVGWDVYKGNCGIALYLLRLAETTGDKRYLEYGKDILKTVEKTLNEADNNALKLMGIGAFTGFNGYIYTVCKCAELGWLEAAEIEARMPIVEKLINYMEEAETENERLDVLSGLSGVLGVFVTLHECIINPKLRGFKVSDESVIKVIAKLSDALLCRLTYFDNGRATWFENGDIGYVHGNAGIMAQLARAAQYIKNEKIYKAIDASLRYEREGRYDKDNERWILRDGVHYMSWCNGIAGILIAKMIMSKAIGKTEQFEDEIRRLAYQLKNVGFGITHCLCHGDMGSLITLRYAADHIQDEELVKECRATASEYIKKNVNKDMFVREDWGLMTGVSGAGFGLLELMEDKDILLSILSLN